MSLVGLIEIVIGFSLVLAVVWDVFQTVVLPRPTPTRWRLAKNLTRYAYRFWRWRALRLSDSNRRERWLGIFGPSIVLVLLIAWILILIVGFGLVFHALGDEFHPPVRSLGSAFYAAGVSLITIGFGDIVPTAGPTRLLVVIAAGTGLGTVALVITYLFSLYGSFQRREILVTTLDARAGAPPSGIALLETYARTKMVGELPRLFGQWETWAAEVLDSHVSYPVLVYFRSTHDNESWISSVGAVLDAAVLSVTTIEDIPTGGAEMFVGIGVHLVEDISSFFGFPQDELPGVEREEFLAVRERLSTAGYAVRPAELGWAAFIEHRRRYAARLNHLAGYLLTPPTQWVGDRETSRVHEV